MSFKERVGASAWTGEIAFTIEERTSERVVGRMPVTEAMLNPFGTVHAGAMIWFADVVATQCAVGDFDALDESGRGFPLAVDLHTVLLANQGDGVFRATADAGQARWHVVGHSYRGARAGGSVVDRNDDDAFQGEVGALFRCVSGRS